MASDPAFIGYLLVFGAAAVACFACIPRARLIEDPDTRRGIIWLLITSGGWATAHVGFLFIPSQQLKTVFYVAGLVIGLSTVGPWLYFCSAYTGRSLHRNKWIRRAAVGVFSVIVLVKLTNPIHQSYFTTKLVTTPFPHLAVHSSIFHWLVMGLAYALAIVGYFMLLELFVQTNYDKTPLIVLVSFTGLPIILDLIAFEFSYLITLTHEPLGVAVFAVGVFYFYIDRFHAIQITGEHDDPVILVTAEGTLRDYNSSAVELFSELEDSAVIGEPFETVVPAVAETLQTTPPILEQQDQDSHRYYRLSENTFGADQAQLGRAITFADVTDQEQYRQQLERQNERLDQFASIISHDLRNPLNMADGWVELAKEECDTEHLDEIDRVHDRMRVLIEDLLTLAREGDSVGEMESIELGWVVKQSWRNVETREASLSVDTDATIKADPDRLQQLLENLIRNAVEHGGDDVTITVGTLADGEGFYIADDGPGISAEDSEQVFKGGYSTKPDGTGLGLDIVREIATAHDWTVRVIESVDGGAQFEIRNAHLDYDE